MKNHGDKYNYRLLPQEVSYQDIVKIICPQHGVFKQKARTHAIGSGCQICAHESRERNLYSSKRHTKDMFIKKARLIYGNYYDYTDVVYTGQMKTITITCRTHGSFTLIANNHLYGVGCSKCKHSRGEIAIGQWLTQHHIQHECQKAFNDLFLPNTIKRTNKPKYDFFLPAFNLLIEYDGQHHFKPVNFRGVSNEEAHRLHERTHLSDSIKNQYAKNHNLKMLRIPYTQFKNISTILETTLLE